MLISSWKTSSGWPSYLCYFFILLALCAQTCTATLIRMTSVYAPTFTVAVLQLVYTFYNYSTRTRFWCYQGLIVNILLHNSEVISLDNLSQALDAKVIIFKKKRRKNYRRTRGHRQVFHTVSVFSHYMTLWTLSSRYVLLTVCCDNSRN